MFFNRLGELRDRTFENQRYRASGLNLVVAAIILWNTVYLSRRSISSGLRGTICRTICWRMLLPSAGSTSA